MHGVFDVRDFGALGDNSTDDTAAFTAALDAAEVLANGSNPYGGVVQVPPGEYFVDQIRMRTQVTLMGFGPSTIIRKIDGSPSPLINLDKGSTNFTVLRDLRLRGNKYGGGGAGSAHGINYSNSEDSNVIRAAERFKFHGDPQHRIFNVTVDAVDGDGMRILARETQIDNCMVGDVTLTGIRLDGSDNWVSNTSVNWAGQRGFYLNGGNNRLTACKAWYIGTDETFEEGDAFRVRAGRQTIVGCEAQDISRYGLYLKGADNCHISGMMLDNIGNLYKNQGVGFDHPPLSGGIYLFRYSDPNHCTHNRISAAYGQRSAISNIDSLVFFGTSVHDNSVDVVGDEAHILTPRPVGRSGHATTYNNFATVNGRVA